ncbi:hypothetical protein EKO27_g2943 [Xylaria grammica]|uniref:F-box domain-containing protein n=1 Tax=Xylaria grammica TaxID=363999 RepID=A0A439DCM4_9PEZI|nr:hypothetical protein EKO27_g2943 [Xylaria grammica]
MSTYLLKLEQPTLDTFQAWRSVREHYNQIKKAASQLEAITMKAHASFETSPSRTPPLSALERLPEETLIAIMEYLDYESLYRLSQMTGYFLRLSFDGVFEKDPSWRIFRYTIDGLGNGPGRTGLDRTQELLPPRHEPVSAFQPETGDKSGSILQISRDNSAASDIENGDGGETMLDFMAREYG